MNRITEIDIRHSKLGSEAFVGLLSQLHEIPSLRYLKLQNSSTSDAQVTTSLVKILQKQTLRKLNLGHLSVDWNVLAESLKADTTLERLIIMPREKDEAQHIPKALLTALEARNTALQNVLIMAPTMTQDIFRVDYLAALNRVGRAQAFQHPPLEELVELLCGVTETERQTSWQMSQLNLIHGLLRINPAVWTR